VSSCELPGFCSPLELQDGFIGDVDSSGNVDRLKPTAFAKPPSRHGRHSHRFAPAVQCNNSATIGSKVGWHDSTLDFLEDYWLIALPGIELTALKEQDHRDILRHATD